MKIVVINGLSVNESHPAWNDLKKLCECYFYDSINPSDTETIVNKIKDANILINAQAIITDQVINSCTNLEYIGLMSTGYNIVDLEAAKYNGICVTNVPDYSTFSVAQYTIGLLLEICNNTNFYSNVVKKGEWLNSRKYHTGEYKIIELENKTLGIIGYGKIGKK